MIRKNTESYLKSIGLIVFDKKTGCQLKKNVGEMNKKQHGFV